MIGVSAEEVQAIMQQMGSSVNTAAIGGIPEVDKEQMQKDSAELTEKLTKAFEEKMGETENGEFTVDGLAFTSRTPVNMTYEEAAELLLTSVNASLAGSRGVRASLTEYAFTALVAMAVMVSIR